MKAELSPEIHAELLRGKNSINEIQGNRVYIATIVEDLISRYLSSYVKRETTKRITKLNNEKAKRKARIKKQIESIRDASHLYKKSETLADLLIK